MAVLKISMEAQKKETLLDVCEKEGVTPSEAVEMLFRDILAHKTLPPFLVKFQKQKSAGQR
ncbi:type II toxin-antitoxin system RelB/DinJ family antitoxin [Gluconobacter cerinus]|uniref:type II toxin-antitoxin system RelB/DinJ family antitoxin n=1 Tax=Gluconobacter cerinus TaxID=38307 RepID=UPI001B8B3004|nr:type II toxin-antitoxin system RelB/DinJ family antitoxin [Gluconobacter cerinus]MBS1039930.1 type II toxin-antitoxin system RelB/DinJ family antitoxin [Gluconobacter cerinus]MBS1045895.1 type II toxin-antitoxin system RelB/DinJ family antitoxin [Gluconobacter cerinus]